MVETKKSSVMHPPTKVVYVRNLSEDIKENDVIELCSPFGKVCDVLLMSEKGHGFVEFEDRSNAVACVKHYCSHPLLLNGQNVEFAFSGRSEITHRSSMPEVSQPNRILLLTVTSLMFEVTVSVIEEVFSQIGYNVDKIVIFNRGHVAQVLVQLSSIDAAIMCKQLLHGKNIYSGCNQIRVQFSSMKRLHVKCNTEKCFDFTGKAEDELSSPKATGRPGVGMMIAPILHVSGINGATADQLAALFAVYANIVSVKIRTSADALILVEDLGQCRLCEKFLDNAVVMGGIIKVEMFVGQEDSLKGGKDFSNQPLLFARQKPERLLKLYAPSVSLHLSNMPDGTTYEELLQVLNHANADLKHIRFLDQQHHIAIAVCRSVENAIDTLVNAHGVPLSNDGSQRLLRIGFGHQPLDPALNSGPFETSKQH